MPSLISTLRIPYGFIDDRLARLFEDIRGAIAEVDQEIGRLRVAVRFAPGAPDVSESAAFVCDDDPLELESAWWTSNVDAGDTTDPKQIFHLRRRNLEGGGATLIGRFDTVDPGLVAYRRREFPVNKEHRRLRTGEPVTLEIEHINLEGGSPAPDADGLLELLFRKAAL